MVSIGSIDKNPAAALQSITVKRKDAEPLSPSQFQELLAAIEPFCATQTGIEHELSAEYEAEFLLQRWAGLRLGDAVALPRCGLVGNRLSLITQKTHATIKGRILPDIVAAKLAALPDNRPAFRNGYFFWPKDITTLESLKSRWSHYIRHLSAVLHFVNERGEFMHFHSHMLRDTCAVQLLLQGVPIEEVSKYLTHESVATTEKYYAPWVKAASV